MDVRNRAHATINERENLLLNKNKVQTLVGGLQNGTTKRAVLGDISSNVRVEPLVCKIKPQNGLSVLDKANIANRRMVTRSYKNVTAKVDTRLLPKVPSVNIKISKDERVNVSDEKNSAISTGSIAARLRDTKISTIPVLKNSSQENLPSKENKKVPLKPKVDLPSNVLNIVKKDSNVAESRPSRKSEAYSTELLHIEDIDSGDGKSPILMGIYIKDIYNYLMQLELNYPIKENHLEGQLCVTPKMRSMLIDWLVEVHIQFTLMLETLHLTVAIIDRYLQLVKTTQRNHIQLIGITAMFIASKYEEMFVPEIQDFVYITDNTYTKSQILQCEKQILSKLDFNLGRPLPLHFERRFIKAAGVQSKNHHLAKYLIDLSLVEYNLAHYRPSELAAGAVCLSISLLSPNTLPEKCWTPTLAYYSGYKFEHISKIVQQIATAVQGVEKSRYRAVMNKYNSSKHGKVSSYPELRSSMISRILGEQSIL